MQYSFQIAFNAYIKNPNNLEGVFDLECRSECFLEFVEFLLSFTQK